MKRREKRRLTGPQGKRRRKSSAVKSRVVGIAVCVGPHENTAADRKQSVDICSRCLPAAGQGLFSSYLLCTLSLCIYA